MDLATRNRVGRGYRKIVPFLFKSFINLKFVTMCFNKSVENPPRTASADILGIKVLRRQPSGKFVSPIRGRTIWTMKRKVLKDWEVKPSICSVHIGLHCFKNIEAAKGGFNQLRDKSLRVFLVIIPKGAKYYENSSQYCSDQMELVSMTPLKIDEDDKRKAKKQAY